MIKLYGMIDLDYPADSNDLVDDQGAIKVCVVTKRGIERMLEEAKEFNWKKGIQSYEEDLKALEENRIVCKRADESSWNIVMRGNDLTEEMVMEAVQFLNANYEDELEEKFEYLPGKEPPWIKS